MKIGIIAPKFNNSLAKRYEFPVGLAYIQGALKNAGYTDISVLNLNHCWDDVQDTISKWIVDQQIDILMTGGLSAWYEKIRSIVDIAREANPKVIAVGGRGIFL